MSEAPTIIVTGPKPSTWKYPLQKTDGRRITAIKMDVCPECGGALDTGWECNDCDFDANPEREAYLRFIQAS